MSAEPPGCAEEDDLFQTLFAAYPDALVVADSAGTIIVANPAATDLLGYPVDELVGSPVDLLLPDSLRARHATYRDAYARDPRPRPMGNDRQLVARRRDGSEVMVEIALSPLRSAGRNLVIAAIRDIGAYPRVKQALRRARYSEQLAWLGRLAVDARDPHPLLAQLPESAASALDVDYAAVFLLDADRLSLRIVGAAGSADIAARAERVQNRADTAPGFALAEGRPVAVADYRTERRFSVPQEYLDDGLTSALWVPMTDRGRALGAITVGSRSGKRFGDDELRFLESLANLLATALQRARSEEALSHAERLESVGQLTGGIAHDFNNLLTVIGGNLQVLEGLPSLQGDVHGLQLLGAAGRAARRGAELTKKLLAFSRRQVLQPAAIDVRALLQSLADMLERTLDQRIRIEVEAADTCPCILADPGQLESALLNIAINARDAMPDGGLLRFRAESCETIPEGTVGDAEATAATTFGFVAISISDTGTGMQDAVRERAFEPFFTTKEAGRGTGLGLSTVYGFVKQSRGAVGIASRAGGGTILTLYLPQSRQATPAIADPSMEAGVVPPGLKVLLVEDDAEVREVAKAFLDALQCDVSSAANGEQAMAMLGEASGFELLLSDIALGPGMRGTRLAAEAQRRNPELAVVLVSGFSEELLQADRDAPPEWELLQKPYSRGELAKAISRVVRR